MSFFEIPKLNDVLCGRGGKANHHPGNRAYRRLVDRKKPIYLSLSNRDKAVLVESIFLAVKKLGGRFLKFKKNSLVWQEINEVKAKEKIAQAMRDQIRCGSEVGQVTEATCVATNHKNRCSASSSSPIDTYTEAKPLASTSSGMATPVGSPQTNLTPSNQLVARENKLHQRVSEGKIVHSETLLIKERSVDFDGQCNLFRQMKSDFKTSSSNPSSRAAGLMEEYDFSPIPLEEMQSKILEQFDLSILMDIKLLHASDITQITGLVGG